MLCYVFPLIHAEFKYMLRKRQLVKYLDVVVHKHAESKMLFIQ